MGAEGYSHPYTWTEFIGFFLIFSFYSFFSLFSFYLWLGALEAWVHRASESEEEKTKRFCALHCVQVARSPLPCMLLLLNAAPLKCCLVLFSSSSSSFSLPSLPTATDAIIFHLIDQSYNLVISSDSTILPAHTTYVLTFLSLPGFFSRNIWRIFIELFSPTKDWIAD